MNPKYIKNIFFLFFLALPFVAITSVYAQQSKRNAQEIQKNVHDWNKKVRISPKASVAQTIGITDVTISYSRPGVKGRQIWDKLVPYNKIWRAGANEATKFSFSNDVIIAGKKLSAGSYSFFVIPNKSEWIIIFNKVADQWGAFEYNKAEDALRFTVKPKPAHFQEWLEYNFSDMKINREGKPNSAEVNLVWEKLEITFEIKTIVN